MRDREICDLPSMIEAWRGVASNLQFADALVTSTSWGPGLFVSSGTTLSPLNYKLFGICDAAVAVPCGDNPPMGHRFGCQFARFDDFNMIAVIDVANAISRSQRRLRLWR
jgi:hypothetical protein